MSSVTAVQQGATRVRAHELLDRLRQSQAWVLVLLLLVGTLIWSPGIVTGANGQELLRQCVILGLLTIGESVVLLGGGIDLSIAANVRFSSVIGATYFMGTDTSLFVGVVLIMGISIGIGLVNGILIGVLRMPSFITTLAVLLTLDGITLLYAESAVGMAPVGLINFYTKSLGYIPMLFVLLIAVAVAGTLALRSTVWGRNVYAVGGDTKLAAHAGVHTPRITISLYVVSGALSGVAAITLLSRTGVGDPTALQGLELQAITAAVIGAVSLAGGRGTILGALGGVAFLTLVSVLLTNAGVPAHYLVLAQGVLILAALATYRAKSADQL
jgi:ribose/xylose/arabinose/galactoside ABC-type transport system permease subunit